MSIWNLFGVSTAMAAPETAAAPQGGGMMSMVWMLVAFAFIFYFLLIRPQSKRAKEQRKLIDSLNKGDEVMTTSGIVGKIDKLNDEFATLTIAENVNITIQKNAIVTVLPKGTIKSI